MPSILGERISKEASFYILLALRENLDVNFLLNNKLNSNQLTEIYNGLKQGVDVSLFASEKYDDIKMRHIREGLVLGLDVEKYLNEAHSPGQMQSIKESLINDTYISVFSDIQINENIIKIASSMILEGLDKAFIEKLINLGYNADDLKRVKRINLLYGDKFNSQFSKRRFKHDILGRIINILSARPEVFDDEMFDYLSSNNFSGAEREGIERILVAGGNLEMCMDFKDKSKTLNEILISLNFDLEKDENLELIENYILKSFLGENFEEEYDLTYVDGVKETLKLHLDTKALIKEGYDGDQLAEIAYAAEDGILDILLPCYNKNISSYEMFLMRNNTLFEKTISKKCKHSKVSYADFNEMIKLEYKNNRWTLLLKKSNVILFESLEIEESIEKAKEIIKLLKEGLEDEEIFLHLNSKE